MSVYIVTGKLGNGKTLVSVGRLYDALAAGRRVATNLDLNLVAMAGPNNKKVDVIRLPDKPNVDDLNALGPAYEGPYDESKFGTLVLDECGTWFNSRNWQDKSRKAVNDWFLHARKLRWDVYLIIQDVNILDSQARDALAEYTVFCRRLDNIRVPLLGPIFQNVLGIRLTLPRVHRAKVVYGISTQDMISDVWTYRGNHMFDYYQTDQVFLNDYPHGIYSMLTPWHTKGRYMVARNKEFYMRMTKIYFKRFKAPVALAVGCLLGVSMAAAGVLGYKHSQYQAKMNELQSLADTLTKSVQTDNEETVDRYNRLAGLERSSIANYLHIGQKQTVSIMVADSDGVENELDISELSRMGVKVKAFGKCDVELTYQGQKIYPTCSNY
ncbi:zonular occludens toxin domain-containing protein [uncultured Zhongshania sp.]|uniref:zonular occludens toxin domain-containing protein n=1 Tax=uncultured Zhongshania sp. TaxID=1642288 RepID=UPI0030D9BA35|tara:strand:+ start:2266 stop:3411 length:1146 start_codon:yes stop_codon:yes gene_type:complete